MSLLETPKFSPTQYRMLDIDEPCKGGVNKEDLEFEQELNQSPNVINMMYRNGALGKRYGRRVYQVYPDTIYDVGVYGDDVFVHAGTKIYKNNPNTEVASGIPASKGMWFNFNRILYYINGAYYQYNGSWATVTPYVPNVLINRKPDGSYKGDTIENYNRIGAGFSTTFHGDGTSKNYILEQTGLDATTPIVKVDNVQKTVGTDFTWNVSTSTVTFTTAPPQGTNNVEIIAYKTDQSYVSSIMNNKYWATYGGNNNSRVFLAGGGESKVYYSHVFDATYFPDNNDFAIGNSNFDVTGFGEQYDILLIFKPTEIFSLDYYVNSNSGVGEFTAKQVNSAIGCDCPDTIELINNQLVWLSTREGVCTLVSTNIEDERNVRPLSRNVNGGHLRSGLMQEQNLTQAKSVDWNGEYLLSVNGNAYLWEYLMTPYMNTGKLDQDAKRLTWYVFSNWDAGGYHEVDNKLYWFVENVLFTTHDRFCDEKWEEVDGSYQKTYYPIIASFQCPLYQFNAVPWLKTVKNVYVQCREDHDSIVNMKYVTEDDQEGEVEPEPIRTFASVRLWGNGENEDTTNFSWDTWAWDIYGLAKTHRRKCNLKKIQMATVIFENGEIDKDLSITHLAFQYAVIKNVK